MHTVDPVSVAIVVAALCEATCLGEPVWFLPNQLITGDFHYAIVEWISYYKKEVHRIEQ